MNGISIYFCYFLIFNVEYCKWNGKDVIGDTQLFNYIASSITERRGDFPISKWVKIFSPITIPSSSRIPIIKIIPKREIILIV